MLHSSDDQCALAHPGTSAQRPPLTRDLPKGPNMSQGHLPQSLVSAHARLDLAMAVNKAAELQVAVVGTVKAMAALGPGPVDLDVVSFDPLLHEACT